MKNKVCILTGAGGGIGSAIAERLFDIGFRLVLLGRNEEKLKKVAKGRECLILPGDICDDNYIKETIEKTVGTYGGIDFLINNAGVGTIGATEQIPLEKDEALMVLNMMAPVVLTKLFLKDMYARRSGKILNVCSTGAYQPGPFTATYYASKSFLLSYTKAVRYEAKSHGVSVCALCPGTTATGFFERADSKAPRGAMSAEQVARYAYRQFKREKAEIIPGLVFRLMKLCPVPIKTAVIAMIKR